MSSTEELGYRRREFVTQLVKWHASNFQRYPWRNTSDPYQILIAELLLRKTTREQVARIFVKFIRQFPNFDKLATADVAKIRSTIKPLGLEHIRAKGLSKLAKEVTAHHNGSLPKDRETLLQLPNVGPYTTNALLCLAYRQDVAMVDTNVIRVISRVFSVASRKKRPHMDFDLWKSVASLIPEGKAREFNLGLLDLASSVCFPRNPNCESCPAMKLCDYATKKSST